MLRQVQFNDPALVREHAFVNGEWVQATIDQAIDPATGDVIGSCPELSTQEVQHAIQSASVAQELLKSSYTRMRATMLQNWARLMRESKADLAQLLTWENGKPINEARAEIEYAASFLEWFAGEAVKSYGDLIQPSNPTSRTITIRQPVGVCALITPWNFPAAMVTKKAGPAIAAGCAVVLKAPAETPLSALALAELSLRAGVPKGVFNVVTADENTVGTGHILTSSPLVQKVSFTGSTRVGKILMSQTSPALKRLSMELGGLAPFIVFEDADIERAVDSAISCKFRGSGQTCVCANIFLIHKQVYHTFAAKFVHRVKQFRLGNGFDAATTHGPLIHDKAVARVDDQVKDAREQGGRVVLGGHLLPELGSNFYAPTVILDAQAGMKFAQDETIGPVAGLIHFSTEEEAIAISNRSDAGLAGYFFSRDVKRCWRVAEKLAVGMVGVNTVGMISDPSTPFGGIKQSGFGREGSKYGLDEYTTIKTVTFSVGA
ncbi:succinate-semialdehyde dehydrogenase [Fusarium oxysporum]|nr:succinate-semialdehyde dehydrogenase [Fusarium oxysporum]